MPVSADKMSSVLDIKYKRPTGFAGSASASLLGGTAHIEGTAAKSKFTHITGIRYKTNQYLLKTLQTEGDFKPSFLDVQTFITYNPHKNLEISFLGNAARNTYQVIPRSRQTSFGTYQQALNFTVYYEGREKDRFITLLGALTLDFHPSENLALNSLVQVSIRLKTSRMTSWVSTGLISWIIRLVPKLPGTAY